MDEMIQAIVEKKRQEFKKENSFSQNSAIIWGAWLETIDVFKEKKETFLFKMNEFYEWYEKQYEEGITPLEECMAYLPIMNLKKRNIDNKWNNDYERYSVAVSTDKDRKGLWGMNMTFCKEGIEYASTDGRRLFVHKSSATGDEKIISEFERGKTTTKTYAETMELSDKPVECILKPLNKKLTDVLGIKSQNDVDELCEKMKDDEYSSNKASNIVSVLGADSDGISCFSQNYIPIYHNGNVYVPMDVTYPNYHHVIPEYEKWQKIHHMERLMPNLLAWDKIAKLIKSSAQGWIIPIDESVRICANVQFMIDGIRSVGGDVTCYIKDISSPICLRNERDFYMLMPFRLENETYKVDVKNPDVLDNLPEFDNTVSYKRWEETNENVKVIDDGKKSSFNDVIDVKQEEKQEEKHVETIEKRKVCLVADDEDNEKKQDEKQEEKVKMDESKTSKNERKEVKCSDNPNSFNNEELESLKEKHKYLKFYGEAYTNISALDYINKLWSLGKFSLKTTPKKNGNGVWRITCEALFDDVSFKYGKYLLNGGNMIQA